MHGSERKLWRTYGKTFWYHQKDVDYFLKEFYSGNDSMGEVVDQNWPTTLDILPERVLTGALEEVLETVVVVGMTKEGSLYVGTSQASQAENVFLLEVAKQQIIIDSMTQED